jgi:RNA polymerase sigma-70 factor (ECF subfamily)
MTWESSDAGLVARIAAGDPQAETDFCRRMAPRVRLYALRHLRNADAADDLSQEVLVITLEALRARRVQDPEKLGSFVLGTCRMAILNQRRGAERKERLLSMYGWELHPQSGGSPNPMELRRLQDCMRRLRERERTVLVMSFYAEQSGAEVAEALGISEANVRVIRHRAIGNLRACMGCAA